MQVTNNPSTTSSALHDVLHSKVSILLLLVPLTIGAEFFSPSIGRLSSFSLH